MAGFFDKILVDAPVPGEGMFRRDEDMVKDWNEKGPEYYVPIQRQILSQAAAMLRPGGIYAVLLPVRLSVEEDGGMWPMSWRNFHRCSCAVWTLIKCREHGGFGLPGCMRPFRTA